MKEEGKNWIKCRKRYLVEIIGVVVSKSRTEKNQGAATIS